MCRNEEDSGWRSTTLKQRSYDVARNGKALAGFVLAAAEMSWRGGEVCKRREAEGSRGGTATPEHTRARLCELFSCLHRGG